MVTSSDSRSAQAANLRAAARSTTPNAYQVPRHQSANPMGQAQASYTTLFGAYFAGATSVRDHVITAAQLGAHGIAYVILILLLNLAQCEWWYEPGMYSGRTEAGRVGGR
jgi:hypothetical protein